MKNQLLIAFLILISAFATLTAHGEDSSQKPAKLDVQIRVEMDYLLYLPKDYSSRDSWPLLLFLHGSGERGSDLELVKVHGPPLLIAEGKQFPMIIVSPQCPKDKSWEPIVLMALLDDLSKKYKIDADRVYLTGLSMGGFGTWHLAAYAPDRFAALAPICGGAEVHLTKRIAHLPVWAFHGAKDGGVPVERTTKMIEGLHKYGGSPKVTIYPEAGHDSWTETYANPEFYNWLLAQKRAPKK